MEITLRKRIIQSDIVTILLEYESTGFLENYLPPEKEDTKVKIVYSDDEPMDFQLWKDGVENQETTCTKKITFDEYIVSLFFMEMI